MRFARGPCHPNGTEAIASCSTTPEGYSAEIASDGADTGIVDHCRTSVRACASTTQRIRSGPKRISCLEFKMANGVRQRNGTHPESKDAQQCRHHPLKLS